MYSREDRKRAVELWLKYDKCATAVTNAPGYAANKNFASARLYTKSNYLKKQPTLLNVFPGKDSKSVF